MLAMGPPLFIVRAVQTGGNSHRSRSSSPSVFRKLPAIVRDHSPYPPNAVATSGRHTHPIVKTEKPCSSYISQTRLPHTPKATCSHSYNVRCRAVSFPPDVCLSLLCARPPEIPVHPPKGGLARGSACQPTLALSQSEEATTKQPASATGRPHRPTPPYDSSSSRFFLPLKSGQTPVQGRR